MRNLTEERSTEILNKCKGKEIAVVGDVMLDRYFWGGVSRVSPEAPVPVVDIERETYHLGGAANVANNLHSLGIKPALCGVVGDDEQGRIFKKISSESGINTDGLFTDTSRPSTVKTRIIGNNQHIARLDVEIRKNISSSAEKHILKFLNEKKNLSGIIIEDYNKGAVTEFLILEIISYAKINNIPVFVDPKINNFFSYKYAALIKPNKKEASAAVGFDLTDMESVVRAGKELMQKLECENLLLTLGKEGMALFEKGGEILSLPTRARNVADVSGAGDTAIATLSACVAGGASVREAVSLSNYAAGAVCEQPGIVSITPERLLKAVNKNLHDVNSIHFEIFE